MFTPVASLLGGILIGVSAVGVLWSFGRVAGISGLLAASWGPRDPERGWKRAFVLGLVFGGGLLVLLLPRATQFTVPLPLPVIGLAGLLVGFGTRLANGCTSGHGVCGVARLSRRSMVATAVFMVTAMAVATLRHGVVP